MSKVVKGIKKGVKKVGKFLKKNWKPIAIAGLAAFTGGLAIGGIGNFSAMLKSGAGLWTTVGSTMKAGITGALGTFGIGSGASGAMAAGAFAGGTSMTGATLLTGAGAQALGLAKAAGGAGVGTYTGPGSSFMGGGGSVFGGGAGSVGPTPIANQLTTGSNMPMSSATQNLRGGTGLLEAGGVSNSGLNAASGGMGWKGMAAAAAVPALINAGGAYFAARGQEEDEKGTYWTASHDNPSALYRQNFASPYAGYMTPDGQNRGYHPDYYQLDEQGGLMALGPTYG